MEQEQKTQWQLKREISLGDLVAIIVALTSVVTAYMHLNTRLSIVEFQIATNTQAVASTLQELKTELRRLSEKIENAYDRRRDP